QAQVISVDPFVDASFTNDAPVRQALQNARDTNVQTTRNSLLRLSPAAPVLSVESAWPLRVGTRTVGAVVLLNALGDADFNTLLGPSGLQGGIVTMQHVLVAGTTNLRQLQQQGKLAGLLTGADDKGTVFHGKVNGASDYYALAETLTVPPSQLVLAVSGGDLASSEAGLRRQLAGLGLIVFLVLSALSFLAVRLALRPVRMLRAAVRNTAEDGTPFVPSLPRSTPPELREVGQALADAAAKLSAALEAQRGQRSHIEAIIDSMAEGVVVSDVNRRVTLVNPVAKQLLGINGAENLNGLLPLESDVTRDSKVIKSRSAPIIAEDGRTTGYVTLLHDASEEAELDRLKSEFVGTVSHELRTPLTSIKGSVDLLLDEETGELNPTQRRFLNTVRRSSDRLINIVSDLLDLSRLEAGRVQLDLHPVDAAHLAEDVVASLGNLFNAKRQQVETQAEPELPPAMADRQRIEQVLVNLLGNASKYTPEGGRVCVSLSRGEPAPDGSTRVRIGVTDSGPGISQPDQYRVFDKFYRAGDVLSQAQQTGTGLGLTIARSLVELHGGTLTVESELGQGCTFIICLPAYEGEE
ncbi:MAG TPA: ATP-binding protein, partial [Chloroflexota bacterium]|nr:ATP-binding protein [Chloroflexota bacterium]